MSFFVSDAIALLGSQEFVIGDTWTDVTANPTWGITPDSSASAILYGSADEGQTWFSLADINPGDNNTAFTTGKPVNALKVYVNGGTTGQTLTVQLTGA